MSYCLLICAYEYYAHCTVLGTVSSDPVYMGQCCNYAQRTSETGEGPALPSISTDEIETILGKRINVALIDCEGCIPQIDKTNLLDETEGVDLILMEEDQIQYGEWHKILYQRNVSNHQSKKQFLFPATHRAQNCAIDSTTAYGTLKTHITISIQLQKDGHSL